MHFHIFHPRASQKRDTQDSSYDSLEELMRGNVDITVSSIKPTIALVNVLHLCFSREPAFLNTANTQ